MYLEKFTQQQQENLYKELNITEESLQRDVNYLIDWMGKQPHLPKVKDEMMLSHLLIQCKNSLEKAKKKIDAYYTMKAVLSHLCTNIDPTEEEFKTIFNITCLIPLPKLTPDGDRILIHRIFEPENSHLLTAENLAKIQFALYDIIRKDDCFRKYILIYDLHNITASYAQAKFQMLRKFIPYAQKSHVLRIHQTHVILRMNSTLLTLFNIVKSSVKKKMADTIILWNDEQPDFAGLFPAEIMPKEYGGTEKSIHKLREEYYEYVCGFRGWFKSEDKNVADLSKRTDHLFKFSMEASMDGSFRQLTID